jgi:hypothetical protein
MILCNTVDALSSLGKDFSGIWDAIQELWGPSC